MEYHFCNLPDARTQASHRISNNYWESLENDEHRDWAECWCRDHHRRIRKAPKFQRNCPIQGLWCKVLWILNKCFYQIKIKHVILFHHGIVGLTERLKLNTQGKLLGKSVQLVALRYTWLRALSHVVWNG